MRQHSYWWNCGVSVEVIQVYEPTRLWNHVYEPIFYIVLQIRSSTKYFLWWCTPSQMLYINSARVCSSINCFRQEGRVNGVKVVFSAMTQCTPSVYAARPSLKQRSAMTQCTPSVYAARPSLKQRSAMTQCTPSVYATRPSHKQRSAMTQCTPSVYAARPSLKQRSAMTQCTPSVYAARPSLKQRSAMTQCTPSVYATRPSHKQRPHQENIWNGTQCNPQSATDHAWRESYSGFTIC